MNWSNTNVAEQTRNKIEQLMSEFNQFILNHHESSSSLDEEIKKQWVSFKQELTQNPTGIKNHQQYIKQISVPLKPELRSIGNSSKSFNNSNIGRRKIIDQHYKLRKDKLVQAAQLIVKLIHKNNKQTFKM